MDVALGLGILSIIVSVVLGGWSVYLAIRGNNFARLSRVEILSERINSNCKRVWDDVNYWKKYIDDHKDDKEYSKEKMSNTLNSMLGFDILSMMEDFAELERLKYEMYVVAYQMGRLLDLCKPLFDLYPCDMVYEKSSYKNVFEEIYDKVNKSRIKWVAD